MNIYNEYDIIGLGESDHIICKNSTERIIHISKNLILNYKYKNFLLETDYLSGLLIDLYIKKEINMTTDELEGLIMPVFRRKLIIKFIKWLRTNNNNKQITFIGANSETYIDTYNLEIFKKSDKFLNILGLLEEFKKIIELISYQCHPNLKHYEGIKALEDLGRYTDKSIIKLKDISINILHKKIIEHKIKTNFEKEIISYLLYNCDIYKNNNNQNLRDKYTYNIIKKYLQSKSIIFYHTLHLVNINGNSRTPLGYWLNKHYKYYAILYSIYDKKYNKPFMNEQFIFNKLGKYTNKIYYNDNKKYEIKYSGEVIVIEDKYF